MKLEAARKVRDALSASIETAEAAGTDVIDLSLIGVLDTAVGVALDSLQRAIDEATAQQQG